MHIWQKIKSGYDSLTLKSTNTTDVLLCDLIHKQMEKIDFNKLEENDADFFVVRKENSFKSKKVKFTHYLLNCTVVWVVSLSTLIKN